MSEGVDGVLDQAIGDLGLLQDEMGQLRVRLSEIDVEAGQLAQQIAALRELAGRYGGEPLPEPVDTEVAALAASAWQPMGRSSAVLKVLRESDGPLGPADITRALKSHGRTGDNEHYVSAALDYLRRKESVDRVGRGQWVTP